MALRNLDLQAQTLYAELLERVLTDTIPPFASRASRAFVSKEVKGRRYWYVQYRDVKAMRQVYLGPETDQLLSIIESIRKSALDHSEGLEKRRQLCSALVAMGAASWPPAIMRVCERLAAQGMFSSGAILVGTLAYGLSGVVLGFRFRAANAMTNDLDFSFNPALELALPDAPETDVPSAIDSLRMGFVPALSLKSDNASTSFRVRGSDLRVDFLTTLRRSGKPVFMKRFNTAALPLPYMDYLIQAPLKAVIPFDAGILANIPNPAHFAVHKLILSTLRPTREEAKARKDIEQASDVFEALIETRPDDANGAVKDAWGRGPKWRKALQTGFRRMNKQRRETAEKLAQGAPIFGKIATH